jgi:hypothetical protein
MSKQDSLFGTAPLAPFSSQGTSSHLVRLQAEHALTHEEQRIVDEWLKQHLVIDATAAKSCFGVSKIAELHQHSATQFDETMSYIAAIKEADHSPVAQPYIDEFTDRQFQLLGRHVLGATDVGATNIGNEIHLSLHLAPEPPEPPGLLKRIFG